MQKKLQGHTTETMRSALLIVAGKPQRNNTGRRPKNRRKDNTKMDQSSEGWIYMTQNRVKQLGLMNSAMKLRVPIQATDLLKGPATATFSIKVLSCGAVRVKKVKCTLVQALRLCTGRTAHRGSRPPLEGGEGSGPRTGRSLPKGKTRYPLYRRLGGPQGRSEQVRKTPPPPGFHPRTVQSLASRYTDYAIRPTAVRVQGINPNFINKA
jgi:hypothetical protein